MEFLDYLKYMVLKDASDLYLTTDAPASAKVHGTLVPIERTPLPPNRVKEIAYNIMSGDQAKAFDQKPEMNLAIAEPNIGRFRVNIFRQRNQIGMVVRLIKSVIPGLEALRLPPILTKLIMQKRGLVLFVGGTGSGKSTSLASLIDYRNTHSSGHIITIEDPIEYVHKHKKSIITQREVGIDTDTYEDALVNTLRQAPDVILIGEVRERHTMEHAIAFSETGHLALSTLHANNANQALDRIINFFPEDRRSQLLMDLSLNLRGIVSQRLIPKPDGKGRVVAVEVLLGTSTVSDLIMKGKVHELKDVMERSENLGMQTFDGALYRLYKAGEITLEEALRNADSQNNLRLRINLEERAPGQAAESADFGAQDEEGEGLALAMEDTDDPGLIRRP